MPKKKNYLDLAKKYLYEFHYPASANYIRKESERVLKNLLPQSKTIKIKEGDEEVGSTPLNLDGLISNFTRYFGDLGGDIDAYETFVQTKLSLISELGNVHSYIAIKKGKNTTNLDLSSLLANTKH